MTCTPGQILLARAQILLILWAVLPQLSAERNRDGIPPSQRKGILHDSWRNYLEAGRIWTEEASNKNGFLWGRSWPPSLPHCTNCASLSENSFYHSFRAYLSTEISNKCLNKRAVISGTKSLSHTMWTWQEFDFLATGWLVLTPYCVLGCTSHQMFAQLYRDISRHHLVHIHWPSATLI